MASINTTAGPVDDGELGLTLIHEHMRVRSEAVSFQRMMLSQDARCTIDWFPEEMVA